MFTKRTDLALEARELWQESAEKTTRLRGVKAAKHKREGYPVTRVDILDPEGERALGKPRGSYLTIDLTSFCAGARTFSPGRCARWAVSCGSCCRRRDRFWWWAWGTGP